MPAEFNNWAEGQPKESDVDTSDCVAMDRADGKWSDNLCNEKKEFICQRTASEAEYKYVDTEKLNWPDAQKSCRKWGGHLASIRSASE